MRRLTLYVRVVLDTNILISALITKGTPPDNLYQAWLNGEIEVVMTAAQIAEIRDVLVRPRLKRLPLMRILMHTLLSLLTPRW